jgi:hypothetical protein
MSLSNFGNNSEITMKKTIILAPIAALALCANYAQAEPSKKAEKPTAHKAKGDPQWTPYASMGLDPSTETLPKYYLGHDCRAIAKKILSLKLKKSEFETTSAYNERLNVLNAERIAGATKLSDVVGFVPSGALSTLSDKYDADRGILRVETYWGDSMQMLDSQLLTSAKLEYKITSKRSYEASNAYGKKVLVNSTSYDTCGIAFSNLQYGTSTITKIDESIEMTPEEARAAKGNIAMMYVGNLSAPYWIEYHDYLKPTIDSPREAAWSGDAIVMKLVQIWLYNKDSGRVYKRIDI